MPKKKSSGSMTSGEKMRVKSAAEFSIYNGLYERATAMIRNRCAVFMHNVEILQRENGIKSQRQLCEEVLENYVSSPRMTSYKNPEHEVPLRTMAIVAAAFGTTIEDLCGKLLDEETHIVSTDEDVSGRPLEEYQKYLGTYSIAYFGTGKPLGANKEYTSNALSYGVLTVYSIKNAIGAISFHVAGLFNCSGTDFESISALLSRYDMSKSLPQIQRHYEEVAAAPRGAADTSKTELKKELKNRLNCLYEGRIRLTDQMAELSLQQVHGPDEVNILMHNRAAGSSVGQDYRGGLATMMSVSRGAEHMPCTQAALLMRGNFVNWAEEDIASMLYLQPPEVQVSDEVKDIVTYMKWLYGSDAEQPISALSEEDKAYCLSSFVEKKLVDVLRRNYLSYYKVSLAMDHNAYVKLKQMGQQEGGQGR